MYASAQNWLRPCLSPIAGAHDKDALNVAVGSLFRQKPQPCLVVAMYDCVRQQDVPVLQLPRRRVSIVIRAIDDTLDRAVKQVGRVN